jgi:UDP-N-acetylmuramate--L-alanine ligase
MDAPPREIPRAVHLIGIGGDGMAALAHCLLGIGCSVSGSDLRSSETTKQLEAIGLKLFIGHTPSNLADAKLVVVSDAIPSGNIELAEARVRGVPMVRRAECLDLLCRSRQAIMVSGAHGKSTSAAMIATVLEHIGARPSFAIGAEVHALGNLRARMANGVHFVAEACEAFGNLALYHPDVAVINNIDDDHLGHYGDQNRLDDAFLAFANRASFAVIANGDDAGVRRIIGSIMRPITTFGLKASNHISATKIELTAGATTFDIQIGGKGAGEIRLPMPGRHSVMNALACIATGRLLGIGIDTIAAGLADFTGVKYRWQPYDAAGYIQLVDDFAHHPTEIAAIVDTARPYSAEVRTSSSPFNHSCSHAPSNWRVRSAGNWQSSTRFICSK